MNLGPALRFASQPSPDSLTAQRWDEQRSTASWHFNRYLDRNATKPSLHYLLGPIISSRHLAAYDGRHMMLPIILPLLCSAFVTALSKEERAAGDFTFFELYTPQAGPCDLVEGPDGNLWGEAILANIIFRVNPTTGQVDEYPIPFTLPPVNLSLAQPANIVDRTELSCGIRSGRDGNLYASNGLHNQLIKIVPSAVPTITAFTPQPYNVLGNLQPFNDLYSAKDGIYFTQTSGNVISFFSFAEQRITKNFQVPTSASFPLGLYVASNGLVIVVELIGNKVLFLNGTSGAIQEYALPELQQGPAVVRAETNNRDIFFSLFTGNGLGKINLDTNAIKLYHTNLTGALGSEDTIDSKGRIWLSFFTINGLAVFDPSSEQYSYVYYPPRGVTLPQGSGLPPYIDVAVNYGPGDAIWFTDVSGNRVGRYRLS